MIHDCNFSKRIELSCGCVLAKCEVCGVKRSVVKCKDSLPKAKDSRDYYIKSCGGVIGDLPQHSRIAGEFEEALRLMGRDFYFNDRKRVLDVGAGVGYFASLFLRTGCSYEACEPDAWACQYLRGAYGIAPYECSFEDLGNVGQFDVLVSAHTLEHFVDAKAALLKMFNIIKKSGIIGLVVPDDTDLWNPDHLWFFKEEVLKTWLEEIGFTDIRIVTQQIVSKERFIYVTAVKE